MDVIYYVACSIDGYIATSSGGVEWLDPFQGAGDDHGFAEFYASVDSLVMGSRTYEFSLEHPPWMAPDKPSWIFTGRDLEVAHANVTLTSAEPPDVVESMQADGLRSVWLLGGGALSASFRRHGLISAYKIAIVPIVLGSGIPLFAPDASNADDTPHERLRLTDTRPFPSGIVQLSYERASDA